jgi:hypothetical protein
MSLANFFQRASLAASTVLQRFDPEEFGRSLEARVVGVHFDDSAATSSEGKETLGLLINLLARLYPRLSLIPHGSVAEQFSGSLKTIALNINPEITFDDSHDASVCVAVGTKRCALRCPAIYIGSDGWGVGVSRRNPVGSGQSNNPLGAGAAACFGAANVFRALFAEQLNNAPIDDEWRLSLLSFEKPHTSYDNPPLSRIQLGETHLVGLGAIGNGAVWALSRIPDISGKLVLVDHETVDLSNIQRYVLAFQSDVNRAKVELAVGAFNQSELILDARSVSWGDYLTQRGNWQLPLVAAAVDSAAVRRGIQASLPQFVLNSWTQPGNLGVSRHGFLDNQACLMCLYVPNERQKHFDELVRDAIGFPTTQEALMEIRHYLYTQLPLERDFLERIAAGLKISVEPLLPLQGKPLNAFYREAICGGIVFSVTKGTTSGNVEVPLAFQSALAGILLASEIILHRSGLRKQTLPTTTTIDLLKPLGSYYSFPQQKHPLGKCICQDPDFVAAYESKYSIGQQFTASES